MGIEFCWQEGEYREPLVPPPERPRRPLRRAVAIGTGLLLVALVVGVMILWHRARYGLRAAQADLQAVVDAEVAALSRGDEEVYLSLQDFNNRQWYRFQELFWDALQRADEDEVRKQIGERRIVDLDLRDDQAWVELQYELEGVLHRRVQFYRLSAGHWRRTAPDVRYLGERREMETAHLRFVYYEREEDIVYAVGDDIEQLYEQILQGFRLSDPGRLLTFEFRPVAEAQPALYSEAHYRVPSPLLLGVRADGQPDEELLASLAHSVGLYLAIEKSGLYVRQPGPGSSWVMLKGIVAWEVEQWKPGSVLPAHWHDWLQEAVAEDDLPPLASLWPPYQFQTDRDSGVAFAQAESVVAYAVELRGPDAVPGLLEALGRKLSPAETIEAALGMDHATFETGWREFVTRSVEPGEHSSTPEVSYWSSNLLGSCTDQLWPSAFGSFASGWAVVGMPDRAGLVHEVVACRLVEPFPGESSALGHMHSR